MSFEDYAKYLEGKDLLQLIREAKMLSDERVTGQGVADIALFMSELMAQAIVANRKSIELSKKESDHAVH